MKPKDTGRVPVTRERGPGWFAHSPAMVTLTTPQRRFLSLHPKGNKFLTWSYRIKSRWMKRPFTGQAWHPVLNLSMYRGKPSQIMREVRRIFNLPGRKEGNRWGLHTTSLPEGVAFDDSLTETWERETLPIEPDQESEQVIQGMEFENRPAIFAETTSGSEKGFAEVEQSHSQESPRREQPRISRSKWPFRLVSPLFVRKEPALLSPEREMELGRKQVPSLPVNKVYARSISATGYRELELLPLKPRKMVLPQAPIMASFSRLAQLPASQPSEPLTLLQRRWQRAQKLEEGKLPAAYAEDQQPLTVFPSLRDEAPLPQKRAVPLRSSTPLDERGTPTDRQLLQLARAARPVRFHIQSTSSQVQPPGAMLILPAANRPANEPAKTITERPVWNQAEQDWPLLNILRQVETQPEEPGESSALQVLRRMWPEQAPVLRQAVESISRLGPGEALTPEARRQALPLNQVGRDLFDVRVHSSPLAQTLRAEAFTTGKHIVFAPGRLDLTTSKGIALLGHELTHIGQPLAFKQESGASQVSEDRGEHEARRQEEQIQRIVEQGWSKTNRMELQHPVRAAATLAVSASSLSIQRLAEDVQGPSQQEEPAANLSPANSTEVNSPQTTQASSQPGPAAASGPAGAPAANANVEALSRQVYAILKNRLRAERDRHQLYSL